MNEFKNYHPIVNFIYFCFAIAFTCIFLHPVTLAISVITSFAYSVVVKGAGAVKKNLMFMLPMLLLMALINPAFNHQGVTILAYLPGGNPLTFESIYYGFVSATMLASVILFFSCFNDVMTSDKFIYLFGRIIPSLSMIFSMVIRFVPRFAEQMKITADAQKCVGRDISNGGFIKRIRNALSVLSVMTTWSLESAVDTADSMKSRGYGLKGRTAFSIYTFTKRDRNALIVILMLSAIVIVGKVMGELDFICFPMIQISEFSIYGLMIFVAYFILLSMPVLIEVGEVLKWRAIKSKI